MPSNTTNAVDWNLTPPKPNVSLPARVLYDERQAGAYLGVCARTIRNLADRGEIPRVRILTSVRYDRADLLAFIEKAKQTVKPSDAQPAEQPAKQSTSESSDIDAKHAPASGDRAA